MTSLVAFGVLSIIASCIGTPEKSSNPVVSSPAASATKAESCKITVDGAERTYLLYIPPNLSKGAPLVFVIHGFTDNARNIMNYTRMNNVADANGFAVCYPQGSKDDKGRNYWEVGYKFTDNLKIDDVKFLVTLAHELQSAYGLSKRNVFATGHSNGAEMSIMLGLHASDTFRAIAPVSGCIMKSTSDALAALPAVPALFISGDADQTTLWDGDMTGDNMWGAYLSVLGMVDTFVKGDPTLVETVADLPDTNKSDGSRITSTTWTNIGTGRQVVFYRVMGGGHDWPGSSGNMDINASVEIWKFFAQYVR